MTPSQSSAKCRKSKLLRGYKRIPDLISPSAAFDLASLIANGWASTQTEAIEKAIHYARNSQIRDNSPA